MAEQLYGAKVHLGQQLAYSEQYDPTLLQPIARAACRQHLLQQNFLGVDIWTAYEISWLDTLGKPRVAMVEFKFPADSSHLIESKSFKYYLNSFNQTRVSSQQALFDILIKDLSAAAGAAVQVSNFSAATAQALPGQIELDGLPLVEPAYTRTLALLQVGEHNVDEVFHSDLLKTNCPVTGQPDWASIWIGYKGLQIDPSSLLAYLVSYRQQQDFHENCVEQIYSDIWQQCKPTRLWVYARYTRRGGLDINPFRASEPMDVPALRGLRQ